MTKKTIAQIFTDRYFLDVCKVKTERQKNAWMFVYKNVYAKLIHFSNRLCIEWATNGFPKNFAKTTLKHAEEKLKEIKKCKE